MKRAVLVVSMIAACSSESTQDRLRNIVDRHRDKVEAVLAHAKDAEAALRSAPLCSTTPFPSGLSFAPATGNTDAEAIGDHDLAIHSQLARARKLLADPNAEGMGPEYVAPVFVHVESLRYLLVVRATAFSSGTIGRKVGLDTFDPGAVSGDATLVELATGKPVACATWSMHAPDQTVSLDPADPSADLAIHVNDWSRAAIAAAVGAGTNGI